MPLNASSLAAMPSAAPRRQNPLLLLVVALALGRLGWMQWGISHEDYQGDFTAYWVAGQALLHGADPYTYHPPAIAGAPFYYTGFLYPPLVADFFAPLARLDFYHAKLVWSALQLVCLAAALGVTARLIRPHTPMAAWAALLAAAAVFPPVLLEFERGQIDCLTFLLVAGGVWAWVARHRSDLAAVLLVAAGVFKLPTLLLLLVPFAFGDKRFIKATLASALVVAVLSLALNGPGLTGRYWLHSLPALAGFGRDAGIAADPPPPVPTPPGGLPSSQGGPLLWPRVTWEGHTYREISSFPTRGSFASSYMSPVPERLRKLATGGGYLLAVVLIVAVGRSGGRRPGQQQSLMKQALLAFAMVAVLVCHPLSWLMNYVWLLYAAPTLLLAAWEWRAPRPLLAGLLAGTLLCFTWIVPHMTGLAYKALDQRFCLGSLLLYVSGAAALVLRFRTPAGIRLDKVMAEEHTGMS